MKYNILVVDDEYDREGDLKDNLNSSQNEFVFHYTKSPVEAVNSINFDETECDLVLMDIKFPSIDKGHTDGIEPGLWALKRIKQMDIDLPVGIMTIQPDIPSSYFSGVQRASFYLNKKDFLPSLGKGGSIQVLHDQIRNALRIRESELRYDHLHRKLANKLSISYEEKEWASSNSAGTIAYCLREDEMILSEINELFKRKREIKLLDVGCGTGRFEILLYDKEGLSIDAIDFAGGMVKGACSNWDAVKSRSKAKVSFSRGIAESLSAYTDKEFDIVLMGFGLLSYTNYSYSLKETFRVLKPGGILILSAYNADSWSLDASKNFREEDIPMVTRLIKQDTGYDKLKLGRWFEIDIKLFTPYELSKSIKEAGFKVLSCHSFPTLYASVPLPFIKQIGVQQTQLLNLVQEKFYFRKDVGFNHKFFEADKEFSENIVKDRGHYIIIRAERPK